MSEKKNLERRPGQPADAPLQPDQLDRLLSALADEAPDMPADFHQRWTGAIAELPQSAPQAAAPTHGAAAKESVPGAPSVKASESTSPATPPAIQSMNAPRRVRKLSPAWSRLISAAAVMIFLIGGTLLTRDSLRLQSMQASKSNARTAQPVFTQAPTAAATEEPVTLTETVSLNAAFKAADAGASEASPAVPAGGIQTAATVQEADAAAEEEIAGADAVTENDEMAYMATEADSMALPEYEESVAADTALDTAPAEEPEMEESAEASDDIASSPLRSFLQDMLLFIRWIAPWALILAVGVLAGLFFNKKRHR